MSTQKHTPGPWVVEYANTGPRFYSDELARQSPHSVNRPIFALDRDDQQARYNASRIVACVNACEGLTDADLEGTPSPLQYMQDKYMEAMDQRDELLEVVLEARDRMLGSSPAITKLRNRADAAIAKAEGAK